MIGRMGERENPWNSVHPVVDKRSLNYAKMLNEASVHCHE
jgi:hypothetical protein